MAFIPLTGGGSLVDNIIDRFQDEPGFDFIAYTDAQEVTGELFRELIGPAFEPYKDLATYAEIQAIPAAIALVDASDNAQKVIEGITTTVEGFAIDAPAVTAYSGNDGFILLKISNQIATPEQSTLQYRINGGAWQSLATLTNEIGTEYVVIPELENNTTYTIEARQSLFGTQSIIASKQVTTTPTVENWNAFFKDTDTRDHFYTDSYTNNNTYGTVTSKTVMGMIFGSEAVVGAIAENDETLGLVENEQNNLDLLVTQANGMLGLTESTNGMNYVVDNAAYRTAIETTATARDAVTTSSTAMAIVTQSQDMLDVIEASSDFRASVLSNSVATDAYASSQLAIDNVIASTNFLNEWLSTETAMVSSANNSAAFETFIANETIMTEIDNSDLNTRILILEQTANQDYANFNNVADFIDDATAMAEVASSQNAMRALVAGVEAEQELVSEPIALNEVFNNLQATLILANNSTAVNAVGASSTAMNLVDANDELLRIFLLELTDKDYTTYADIDAVIADTTAKDSILNSTPNLILGYVSTVYTEIDANELTSSQTIMETFTNSEELMLFAANDATLTDSIIESQIAMSEINTNDLALRILVLEQTNQDYTQFADFDAVAASQTAIEEVAASQTAMEVVSNSTTALTKTFNVNSTREAFWDSQQASNILMDDNNLSRQWMLDNVTTNYSVAGNNTTAERFSGKAFILSASQSYTGSSNRQPGFQGMIQPGNTTTQSTGAQSLRVNPLRINSGTANGFGERFVVAVQMQ